MNRDVTTPVWAIETYREIWLACRAVHRRAFRSYRRLVYAKRPEYSWGHHVAGFHQEVVHKARTLFGPQQAAREIEFTNNDERFEIHLDALTRVRFAAVHKQGRPNINGTEPGQLLLYTQGAAVDDEAVILVGCELDPSWEESPKVSVMIFKDGKRLWKFRAADVAMNQVLEAHRRAG